MKLKWHNEKRKLSELKPAEYNPRKMTKSQEQNLTESIDKFELCDPIIINTNNTVIGGHQRLKILKAKGILEVDVRVPNRELTIDEEKELNLRLNKNFGEWDFESLLKFDMNLLENVGFISDDILSYNNIVEIDNSNEIGSSQQSKYEPNNCHIQLGKIMINISQKDQKKYYKKGFKILYDIKELNYKQKEIILKYIGKICEILFNKIEK